MKTYTLTPAQINYLIRVVRDDREETREADGRAQILPTHVLAALIDADGIIIVQTEQK